MKYFKIAITILLVELSVGLGSTIKYKDIPEPPTLPELDVDQLPIYLKNLVTTKKPKTKSLPIKGKTTGMHLINDRGYVWNDVTAPKVIYHIGEKGPDDVEETYINDLDSSTNKNMKTTTDHNEIDIEATDLNNVINDLKDVFKSLTGKNIKIPKHDTKDTDDGKKTEKTEITTQSPKNYSKDDPNKPREIVNIMDDLEDIYNTIKNTKLPTNNSKTLRHSDEFVAMNTTEKSATVTSSPANNDAKIIDADELRNILSDILKNIANTLQSKKPVSVISIPTTNMTGRTSDSTPKEVNDTIPKKTQTPSNQATVDGLSDSKEIKHNTTTEMSTVVNEADLANNTVTDGNNENKGRQEIAEPNFLENLIKNETFWKWLGDLTSKYLDMLMNRITEIIKEEVASQIKYHLKHNNITTGKADNTKTEDDVTKSSNDNNSNKDDSNNSTTTLDEPIKAVDNETITSDKDNTGLSKKHNDDGNNGVNSTGVNNSTKVQNINGTEPAVNDHSNDNTTTVKNNTISDSNKPEDNTNLSKKHDDGNNSVNNTVVDNSTNVQNINGIEPTDHDHSNNTTTMKNNTVSDNKVPENKRTLSKIHDDVNSSVNNTAVDNSTNVQDINETKLPEKVHSNDDTTTVKNNTISDNKKAGDNISDINSHKETAAANITSLDDVIKNSTNLAKDVPLKINAQTIYGNSVGNGKVTNIYIFRVNNVSDISDLKPASAALTGFLTLGPHQNIIITDNNNKTQPINNVISNKDSVTTEIKPNNSKLSENVTEKVTDTEVHSTTSQPLTTSEATTITTTQASR